MSNTPIDKFVGQCFSDLQNTLSRDEIRIIQEYRKLPGWGTMTLTKADNSLKFIEKTDRAGY